jgi:GTP:adenosylcobinamide-phosphate guanylyltransferase
MDAVITAGGIPKREDALYPYTQGRSKALVEIAGKPLIQWVLDALEDAKTVERIVIVGLDSSNNLRCKKQMAFVPNQGSMLNNIRAGVKEVSAINPEAVFALVVSADIPAITGEMIDWIVNTSMETDDDIYYSVVPREIMEKRYLESQRSFIRLKGMEVCGADISVVRISVVAGRDEIWNRLIAARKNVFKQASLIGYDTLILLLLRRLTLDKAVRVVAGRLDLKGRALISPYAEIGMDVDKPYQFDLLRDDLEEQLGHEFKNNSG